MALLAAAGHSLTIVTHDAGRLRIGRSFGRRDRRDATQRSGSAAALIGAEYRCAEFRDLAVFSDDASRRARGRDPAAN